MSLIPFVIHGRCKFGTWRASLPGEHNFLVRARYQWNKYIAKAKNKRYLGEKWDCRPLQASVYESHA